MFLLNHPLSVIEWKHWNEFDMVRGDSNWFIIKTKIDSFLFWFENDSVILLVLCVNKKIEEKIEKCCMCSYCHFLTEKNIMPRYMREYKKKKENEQGKMCKDFVDYSIPVLSLS